MKNRIQLKRCGFSVIELLITIGIMAIVALAAYFLTTKMFNEQKRMSVKADFVSTESMVQQLISNNIDCDCQIKGKTFNSTDANSAIDLQKLKTGCGTNADDFVKTPDAVGSPTANVATRIYIDGISSTGNADEYNARFNIVPQMPAGSTQIKPTPLILRFHTDPTSPASAKVINGCGPAPLSVPTNFTATPEDASCQLNWKYSSGAGPIQYKIYYSTISGEANDKKGTLTCSPFSTVNSCVATGLTNGTLYYFSIQATNAYQATAFYSPEAKCTPVAIPDPPVNITTTPQDKSCHLTWQAPANGTQPITYNVHYSSTLNGAEKGTLGCSTTNLNCNVGGLTNGTTYYFVISGTNFGGTGAYSNPEVTCVPMAPPTAPTGLVTAPGNKSCDLTWNLSSGDPQITYTVHKGAAGSAKSGPAAVGCSPILDPSSSCTNTGLTNGTTYHYSVEASNAAGSAFSTEASCKPVAPPPVSGAWACTSMGMSCGSMVWVMCSGPGLLPFSSANGVSCSPVGTSCYHSIGGACSFEHCTCN